MRLLSLLTFFTLLSACAPIPTEPERTPVIVPPSVQVDSFPGNTTPTLPDTPAPPPNPQLAHHPLQHLTISIAGVELQLITFDTRNYTLAITDQANGVGTQFQSAQQAAASRSALAAINGGFFTPEGQPLGLVFENGSPFGSNNKSSLGSGFLTINNNGPQLIRRQNFPATWSGDALQTGPFLVENSRPVSGLSNSEARIRSLLLWDGEHHFALAQSGPITLNNLARALASQPLPKFHILSALNLDGGRSSDLYLSSKFSSGPQSFRRWWNKPVRNYVLLLKNK